MRSDYSLNSIQYNCQPLFDEFVRVFNLRHGNSWFVMREQGRDGKILRDHREDSNVAVGRIGNLAR